MGNEWIAGVKQSTTVSQVASLLGLNLRLRNMAPCPVCSADKRGKADSRGPIGIGPKNDSWKCFSCDIEGDVIELVCQSVLNESSKSLDSQGWQKIKDWFADHGFLRDFDDADESKPRARHGKVRSVGSMVDAMLGKRSCKKTHGAPPDQEEGSDKDQEQDAPKSRKAQRRGIWTWDSVDPDQCVSALWGGSKEAEHALDYLLGMRRLSEEAVKFFKIGLYLNKADGKPVITDGRPAITIPLFDSDGRIVNIRFRQVPVIGSCSPDCNTMLGCKECRGYRVCSGRPLPLYGSHLLSADRSIPVLAVEGELDVLALYTYGFKENVVSTTGGATTFNDEWLDQLEPYDLIIGCYDSDTKGAEGWASAAEKLGTHRCACATLPEKDANACLIIGTPVETMQRAIARARPAHGIEMKKVDEYADALEILIEQPDLLKGVPTGSDLLDEMIAGWRPGVVVISGETSTGKTTFATWSLLQLARVNYGVMITSFEQEPIGSVQKILRNEVGGDFTRVSKETRLFALQTLAELPLHILDHYGHITPIKMIETIRYAKRRHNTRFFLIDHLGFLIDPDAENERRAIEAIVRALEVVAKQLQVTIFLVAHPHNVPRKEWKGKQERISMRDIKGSSAIRQDADDVLIVEVLAPTEKIPFPRTRIWADKIRSDFGVSGKHVILAFDPGSCCYADEWEQTPAGKAGWLVPRKK